MNDRARGSLRVPPGVEDDRGSAGRDKQELADTLAARIRRAVARIQSTTEAVAEAHKLHQAADQELDELMEEVAGLLAGRRRFDEPAEGTS